jgi:hypothetical protein
MTDRKMIAKGLIKGILAAMVLLFLIVESSAQMQASLIFNLNLPDIALIDVEPKENNNITLSVPPPVRAGEGLDVSQVRNEELWINYTTSRRSNGAYRSVQVTMDGTIPAGMRIKLTASARAAGKGRGTFGTPAGTLTLGSSPQTLISGIGGCFTGDGINNGHQLVFTLEVTDYALIEQVQDANLLLTYTLVDN